MTQLSYFNEMFFPELANSNVESITTSLLYYVITGRNAWHSTWITRYTENCLHASLEQAKEHVEKKRTQGTVFSIKELPAIIFRSTNGCLVVTQINSLNPLAGYSPNATTPNVEPGLTKIDGALDNYICRDAPILGAALSFSPESRFWLTKPSPTNSIITIATDDSLISFSELPDRELSIRTSFSHGGNCSLGWTLKSSGVIKTGVSRILTTSS
jgi:hypothetical protein